MAKTELEVRTKQFALDLIDLVERLPAGRAGDPLKKLNTRPIAQSLRERQMCGPRRATVA